MRKMKVRVEIVLTITANEGEELTDIINEMDYNFTASSDTGATIEDSEIKEFEVIDSK